MAITSVYPNHNCYSSIGDNENDTLLEDFDEDDNNHSAIHEQLLEKQQHQEYQQQRQIIPKFFTSIFGEREWIRIHCSNDWLAAMWIFLYVTLFMMIGSLIMAVISLHALDKNQLEVYDWWSSTVDCLMFLIGSAYMCAGSYPQQNHHHHHQPNSKHIENNNNSNNDGNNTQLFKHNNNQSFITKSECDYDCSCCRCMNYDHKECTSINNSSKQQSCIYNTIATITPQTATKTVTKSANTAKPSVLYNTKYISKSRQFQQPKQAQVGSLYATTAKQSIKINDSDEKAPLLG